MKPDFYLIVANWKMQLSFNETLEFVTTHHGNLIELGKKASGVRIVLCPSFPTIYPLRQLFKNSAISLGAQDCSSFRSGAYTGQICAKSLVQIGCHYCIIGHSERRHHNHETNEEVTDKTIRLLEQDLQPIICVGESKEEYQAKKTFTVLKHQLTPILNKIANFELSELPIYIAYEPIWSIGTGLVPSNAYLTSIFDWLHKHTQQALGKERIIGILYGGSVSPQTAPAIRKVQGLSGLLVGGASLDFQKFNNIVNLYKS